MKKMLLSAVAVSALCGGAAIAADMPVKARPAVAAPASPWDWAFGGALMTDYNFRGISQSNRGPSVTAYSETRYNVNSNFQLYAGSQSWAVTLPTNPTAEVDLYAGIRPTVGPLAFDFGVMYYWYPRENQYANIGGVAVPGAVAPALPNGNVTLADTDMWEVYGKVVWDVVANRFAVGANVYYTPSWLHTGASGLYATVTAKATMPSFRLGIGLFDEIGWYISGELGHYWLGTTNTVPGVFVPAINLPDYTAWNVGLAFTWKVFTADVRYYGTDLSRANCNVLTSDPNATFAAGNVTALNPSGLGSRWCSSTVIGALKFDLTAAANLR
jgi:uncharacterized protein (TIGR02001 family)